MANLAPKIMRIQLVFLKALFLVAFLIGFAPATRAATFVVNTTAGTFDGVCNENCSIRDAVAAANTVPTNDEINFDPVVFANPATIPMGGNLIDIFGLGSLTINGPGPERLTISGENLGRIMRIQQNAIAVINGLTIQDGAVLDFGVSGGIVNFGRVTLNQVVVRNNNGASYGGGIYNSGVLAVTDSVIADNTATLNGGGIANEYPGSTLVVTNSTISGNHCMRDGGGIYNNGALTVINSTISDNFATSETDGGSGGGFSSTAMANDNTSVLVVNSTISRNTVRFSGGGIINNGSPVTLINCTINGNRATKHLAGGVFNFTGTYPLSRITATNTIIADNIALTSPDYAGPLVSSGYNLIENPTGMTLTGNTVGNVIGQDPKLGPLANNGGPTRTCLLLPASPALDAGPTDFPPTDQRFYARPADGDGNGSARADMGAVEVNAIPATITATVSGRLNLASGNGSFPALVTLTDSAGNSWVGVTNPFGYYYFSGVPAGRTCTLRIAHKRFSLTPRVFFVAADVTVDTISINN
jgi:CSLREA domain-containing protein